MAKRRNVSNPRRTIAIAATWALTMVHPARGAVVVLANRSPDPVSVVAVVDDKLPQSLTIAPGDSRPLFAMGSARLLMTGAVAGRDLPLEPDTAYYVDPDPTNDSFTLKQIPLGETPGRAWNPPERPPLEFAGAEIVSVKVYVDDDEVRPRSAWEPVIRQRIVKASEALDAHCGLRLRIVALETWDSDDAQTDFFQSLAEFERETLPAPGTVAIGFSSQYLAVKGRVHMGGTRGPLHSHVLIKERARNMLEAERVELLVHELGHCFGATHSAEPASVMRPVLGQGRMRYAGARIQFDPPNTLLLSLMAEEIRQRRVRKLDDLSAETRRRMREIYTVMNETVRDDPAAGHYLQLMASANARPVVEDARKIAQHIVRAAKVQQKLDASTPPEGAVPAGDRLVQVCVREGAVAAKQLRPESSGQALLLALGAVLGDSASLQRHPIAARIIPHIESERERKERIAALGEPTMRGRADLAKHFFVSAHLVGLVGSEATRGVGLAKELADANGGTGFSFADMAANRAGIVFASALLGRRLSLDDVAGQFTVEAVLPPVDDLQEQLGADELEKDFGGLTGDRLNAELSRIDARIIVLPIYQSPPPAIAK